jgi:hypothetical protein
MKKKIKKITQLYPIKNGSTLNSEIELHQKA